eukprot:3654235-Amphidinium_carterae.1
MHYSQRSSASIGRYGGAVVQRFIGYAYHGWALRKARHVASLAVSGPASISTMMLIQSQTTSVLSKPPTCSQQYGGAGAQVMPSMPRLRHEHIWHQPRSGIAARYDPRVLVS